MCTASFAQGNRDFGAGERAGTDAPEAVGHRGHHLVEIRVVSVEAFDAGVVAPTCSVSAGKK